jgi:hypothetical protein
MMSVVVCEGDAIHARNQFACDNIKDETPCKPKIKTPLSGENNSGA